MGVSLSLGVGRLGFRLTQPEVLRSLPVAAFVAAIVVWGAVQVWPKPPSLSYEARLVSGFPRPSTLPIEHRDVIATSPVDPFPLTAAVRAGDIVRVRSLLDAMPSLIREASVLAGADGPVLLADAHPDIVELLLERGAPEPQLETAVGANGLNAVARLLKKGTKVDGDSLGQVFKLSEPLREPMLDRLLTGKLMPGATAIALESAQGESAVPLVAKIVKRGVAWSWSRGPDEPVAAPLLQAAERNDLPVARAFIKAGAPVNLVVADHGTALEVAASVPDGALMVELLLEHGANPNLHSAEESPLILAAVAGEDRSLRALLFHGAAVNMRVNGRNAFEAADETGQVTTARILQGAGGVRIAKKDEGHTIKSQSAEDVLRAAMGATENTL